VKTTKLIWAALFCAATPACANAIQYDDPIPTPKKDAAAADTGHDTGVVQQDSGVAEDTGVVEDTGSQCKLGISYGPGQCDTCMQANCCMADNACIKSSQCTDYLNCGNACVNQADPQTCLTQCANTYPQGATLLDNIMTCMDTSCGNDCR
jgi:hypothetical protein